MWLMQLSRAVAMEACWPNHPGYCIEPRTLSLSDETLAAIVMFEDAHALLSSLSFYSGHPNRAIA